MTLLAVTAKDRAVTTPTGQLDLVLWPPRYALSTKRKPLLACHAANGNALKAGAWIAQGGYYELPHLLATRYNVPTVSSDQDGTPATKTQSYGNDNARAATLAQLTAQRAALGAPAGAIPAWCMSMGGALAFGLAAANPGLFSCIVAVCPVSDLHDLYTRSKAQSPTPGSGGNWETQETAAGLSGETAMLPWWASHSPLELAQAGAFAGLPVLIYQALDDVFVLPQYQRDLRDAIGSSCTLVETATGGHSAAPMNVPAAARFIAQHA